MHFFHTRLVSGEGGCRWGKGLRQGEAGVRGGKMQGGSGEKRVWRERPLGAFGGKGVIICDVCLFFRGRVFMSGNLCKFANPKK